MHRNQVALSVFIVAAFASFSPEPGQAQDSAALAGSVFDAANAVIAKATVELKSQETGQILTRSTDATGSFLFSGLAAGTYELRVSSPGFKNYVAIIRLENSTKPQKHDVVLQVASIFESVTVTADPIIFSTQSATLMSTEPARDRGVRRRGANTEVYDHYVENEFAVTKTSPLSTFSTDVDTASYANVRRFLQSGELPPPDSVRIEELINYFTYDYPLPKRKKPVSLTTHLTPSPWNPGRQLLHIGLRTTPIASEKLPPSRLTFLIDVSGSMMGPGRLPLVKTALRMLVEQLRAQDSVAIVVYAGNDAIALEPTPGSEKAAILAAIDSLEAGGVTNGAEGIRSAYELARRAFLRAGNNRVILATDGDFNVGVTSDEELVELIEKERESGIFLSVLGFGMGNLKDSKMEKLADHGNGNYAYIDTPNEARKVLVEQMGATLVTVAKDVKLQIGFNRAMVQSWRLIGYENRVLTAEEFSDDRKDAGDLGAGHQVTALYELIPTERAQKLSADLTSSAKLASIKLRYKKPQARKSQLMKWAVRSEMDATSSPGARLAVAVAEYGMLLRQSKFAGAASFDHVLTEAEFVARNANDEHRAEFLELTKLAKRLTANSE